MTDRAAVQQGDGTRRAPRGFLIRAAVLVLVGLVLAIGGSRLVSLGGSPYYLLAGIAVLAAGVLIGRGNEAGVWLYALFLLATAVWALAEFGLDGWALLPTLAGPAAVGFWLLIPFGGRRLLWSAGRIPRPRPLPAFGLALAVILIATTVAASHLPPSPIATVARAGVEATDGAATEWLNYGNTIGGTRHTIAGEITPDNVRNLQLAWTFRSGDIPATPFSYEVTPLKVGNILYICTPRREVIALDIDSGRQVWRFVPKIDNMAVQTGKVCRGVSFHRQAGVSGPCAGRILATNTDGRLWALDAMTGRPCAGFGRDGSILLTDGLGYVAAGRAYNTSPGVVVGNRIILGGFVVDGEAIDAPSGVVRAYDVVSGALLWAWDVGSPHRTGAPPLGESYTRSTPNAWTIFSADRDLGLVYIPTGNSSPDFFGGYRRPFDEKYGTSLVALDVATGRPRWSYQFVHHDLWDLDVPAQPILATIRDGAIDRAVVIQITKTGDIYILDRRTGKPVVGVTERPAPQNGAAPGERLSPTQPASALSYAHPPLRESDMWGVTPIDQMLCRIRFRQSRYTGAFTPPGLTQAIGFPSSIGAFGWGGGSLDEARGILVTNATYMPFLTRLIARTASEMANGAKGEVAGSEYGLLQQAGTPYKYSAGPFLNALGVPCMRPPWGELIAIDVNTRKTLWRQPLGSPHDSGPLGLSSHLSITMGMPNAGGAITTSAGLIFIGAALDRYLRAFDIRDGRELWRGRVPAGAQSNPMSYVSGKTGRQYVVIAAGGHAGLLTRRGDYLVAFALPKSAPR